MLLFLSVNYCYEAKDLQRNIRFFLFEESQWYLIVSIGLFLHSSVGTLFALTVTQGIIATAQTICVFVLIKQATK